MKIGVFDSGIGGKSVANALQVAFPESEIQYVSDVEHLPYGDRLHEEIITLTTKAIQPLIEQACDVIVLACNTATAAAIEHLRAAYPAIPFIGLEPMVKPAVALSKSGVIALCATPSTLSSDRYARLKAAYAKDATILEPDCHTWAVMIEENRVDHELIAQTVTEVCDAGADVIVLACTHYHWIKEGIMATAKDRAVVIDPSEAIVRRVQSLVDAL
jgi:glutamate racemase